ncbi:hypothetical protein EYF80_064792 [Liparis tanakae]|uniref:Uncharacterized protein n=1 Tax=Liparis tanakae TaxID=230148 RepID=A0A4Z2E8J4_9TELE|nr:hypothetical protein EYF80_064792 [Liparis tanakae]
MAFKKAASPQPDPSEACSSRRGVVMDEALQAIRAPRGASKTLDGFPGEASASLDVRDDFKKPK